MKAQKRELKDITEGTEDPTIRVIYNATKMELYRLIVAIYQQFPSPPGKYKSSDISLEIESLVDDNFPANFLTYQQWQHKFNPCVKEIQSVYWRIGPIIDHIISVNKKSLLLEEILREQRKALHTQLPEIELTLLDGRERVLAENALYTNFLIIY